MIVYLNLSLTGRSPSGLQRDKLPLNVNSDSLLGKFTHERLST